MGVLHDLGAERAARDPWASAAVVPGETARNQFILRTATQLRLMRATAEANTSLADWIRLLEQELEAAKLSTSR